MTNDHESDTLPKTVKANNEIKPASEDDVERSRKLADKIEHPDDRTEEPD